MVEKYVLLLIEEFYQVGHEGQKFDLMCFLNHLLVVLINLWYQLKFLFLLMEKSLFCVVVV